MTELIMTGQDSPALERIPSEESAKRRPWATMPTDGSGRLTRAERVLYMIFAAVGMVALVWTAALATGITQHHNAAHDRQMIIQGGYLSWQAADGCGRGPAQCRATLREANANRYGVRVMEDGSLIER